MMLGLHHYNRHEWSICNDVHFAVGWTLTQLMKKTWIIAFDRHDFATKMWLRLENHFKDTIWKLFYADYNGTVPSSISYSLFPIPTSSIYGRNGTSITLATCTARTGMLFLPIFGLILKILAMSKFVENSCQCVLILPQKQKGWSHISID